MKLSLLVLSEGKASGTSIPVPLAQFVIGRDPQCQLRPNSPLISKRHCALLVKGTKVFLRDFGSTNGTFINDEPVKSERQLNHDDILKIGPLLFRVQIENSVPVDKPTPPPPQVTKATQEAGGDDESIAAMLLSLHEEGDDPTATQDSKEEEIPSGTTVMEIPILPPGSPAAPPEDDKDKDKEAKDKKKAQKPEGKENSGATAAAAAALLAKYSKRPRK
jgi:pSer/pThr/pTyr-binding forkhead associated (FHA) protein